MAFQFGFDVINCDDARRNRESLISTDTHDYLCIILNHNYREGWEDLSMVKYWTKDEKRYADFKSSVSFWHSRLI
jgi:hypothetical protein